MKITSVRNFDESIAKLSVASPAAVALKSSAAKTVLTVQPLPEVVTAKNPLLVGTPELGKSLGRSIPGLGNNSLPSGIGQIGLPGGIGKIGLGGFGQAGLGGFGSFGLGGFGLGGFGPAGLGSFGQIGLGGFGQGDLPGGFSIPGGIGRRGGPALKMPGADRMDGDSGFGVFGKGTWTTIPEAFTAAAAAGRPWAVTAWASTSAGSSVRLRVTRTAGTSRAQVMPRTVHPKQSGAAEAPARPAALPKGWTGAEVPESRTAPPAPRPRTTTRRRRRVRTTSVPRPTTPQRSQRRRTTQRSLRTTRRKTTMLESRTPSQCRILKTVAAAHPGRASRSRAISSPQTPRTPEEVRHGRGPRC